MRACRLRRLVVSHGTRMKSKIMRFLIASLALLVAVSVAVFGLLAYSMSSRSAQTIDSVGAFYMSTTSDRLSKHFETTVVLRLDQVEAIIEACPPREGSQTALRSALVASAKARGFEYLALYSETGKFNMLDGSELAVTDPEPFLRSLNEGGKKVAVGSDAAGNSVVLFAVDAQYQMAAGEVSTALVAALPVQYIQQTLSLDEGDSEIYSHIIRQDGSFVIRSGGAYRENYFDRIRGTFDELNGKGADAYAQELEESIVNGEDYSAVIKINGERRHLYCTQLAYSEWHLVTIMLDGTLDKEVGNLTAYQMWAAFGSCGVILTLLLVIFFIYMRMSSQQMEGLKLARKEALRASQAKSEFLSNMSHDIRTPMNAIVGMTAIATANIDNPDQVQNCLKKITLSSRHLLGLINDVLDMAKIESGKMTLNVDQVSLREVMDSIVCIVQPQVRAKHQSFNVNIHDITAENVLCDSVRLNQVLLNLLSNAIKFTPDHGEIRLSLYEEPSPKGDGYVRVHLQVKDNGIGMSDEFQAKIFDSFAREDSARVHHTEGTGLGMAITRYIVVEAMKGSIEVESHQGKGTEFNVTLDLEKTEVQETEMILPNWNMLVVDDDQQLCESTAAALKSIGICAEWTLSGESAVKMVLARKDRPDEYQIILLDWRLPGMSGIQTAREIREQMGDSIPILLISAYDWSEIEEEAKAAGVNGFISKPLFKSTLFYGLRDYVHTETAEVAEPEEHMPDFAGVRVLLAEDNDLNWEIAEALLTDLGMELDWAENGEICAEKFKASPEGYYHAVLMDLRMPVKNGYEATAAIRSSGRADANLPIIAMTADAFSEDIQRCLACGMNAHVAKPIDVQEIARLLEKFLGRE